MNPFTWLLVTHLVADWIVAQTDWEAMNKAKNWLACASHAAKWTLCLLAAVLCLGGGPKALLLTVAMGVLHALIDRRTPVLWLMRVKEYIPLGFPIMGGERRDPPFWLVICVDQVLHIVQVAIIASAL